MYNMGFIIIYVTYKNLEEAERIVKHLLEEKLIACANLFPIKSLYLWKGKIEDNNEIVSILKSKKENLEKIAKFIACIDKKIPWHISRFFPMYKMTDKPITPLTTLEEAYKIGKKHLKYVYIGNV